MTSENIAAHREGQVNQSHGGASLARNLAAAIAATAGVAALAWATLDWFGYTGFMISQIWR